MVLIPFILHPDKSKTLGVKGRPVVVKDWGWEKGLGKSKRRFWGHNGTSQYPGCGGAYLTKHLTKLIHCTLQRVDFISYKLYFNKPDFKKEVTSSLMFIYLTL